MKNAQEMHQYAQKYLSDRFYKGRANISAFQTIEKNLNQNENVLIAFYAASGTISKDRIWNVAVAVTQKRLLISYKIDTILSPFIKQNCKTYGLKYINSVSTKGCMLEISITAEGNIVIGNWSPEKRDDLSIKIRNIVEQYQEESSTQHLSVNQLSIADEIKKFKELLDSGIITQEEFDAKKKQLLGL